MSNKKRRWFQVHLSTAIVLTIVAGLILYANVTARQNEDRVLVVTPSTIEMLVTYESEVSGIRCFGWPWITVEQVKLNQPKGWTYSGIRYDGLMKSSAIAILILIVTGFFSEWWIIRRREVRKQ